MQSSSPSWRGTPFQIGSRYRTRVSTPSLPAERSLVAGEIVIYEQSSYSRYDGCSVYHFVTDAGAPRDWWLRDDLPLDHWREIFEPAEMG